jgi:rhamnosyltransferase
VERVKATVAILTFNGQEFLDELLRACLAQDADFPFDVLVLDSGSTDGTLEILRRFPDVRLHQIPNREFGHGRTRNLAASLSDSAFVVYLTQDATPIGRTWLNDLLAPFYADPRLAGVFARQVPRPGCGPTTSREVLDVFRDPPSDFFSNVCSAVRRSAWGEIRFRDVTYAEDRAFAADATAGGWHIRYAAKAAVHHSHDLPLAAYFLRMYDEAKGVAATGQRPRTDLLWLTGATVLSTLKDWRLLATNDGYQPRDTARWAVRVPAYNAARRLAIWLAGRPLPERVSGLLSLDAQRRRVATS